MCDKLFDTQLASASPNTSTTKRIEKCAVRQLLLNEKQYTAIKPMHTVDHLSETLFLAKKTDS